MKYNGKRPQTPLLWDFSVCLYYTIRAFTRQLTRERGNKHSGDRTAAGSQQRPDDLEHVQSPLPPRGGTRLANLKPNNPKIIFLAFFRGFLGEIKNRAALQCGSMTLWRRRRDSNPCGVAPKRFSRPPRYDHFDTSPYIRAVSKTAVKRVLIYYITFYDKCQALRKKNLAPLTKSHF